MLYAMQFTNTYARSRYLFNIYYITYLHSQYPFLCCMTTYSNKNFISCHLSTHTRSLILFFSCYTSRALNTKDSIGYTDAAISFLQWYLTHTYTRTLTKPEKKQKKVNSSVFPHTAGHQSRTTSLCGYRCTSYTRYIIFFSDIMSNI